MKVQRKNLLQYIDTEKLLNTKINLGSYEYYSVVATQGNFESDGLCLYITLLNNEYVQNHTLQQCQHVCDELTNLQHHYKYNFQLSNKNIMEQENYLANIEKIKKSSLPVVIIRITNPLLRDAKFEDFDVIVGDEYNKFAAYNVKPRTLKEPLIFHDDQGKIILDYDQLRFPEGIKKLRYAIVSTMDQEQKDEYISQYTAYCKERVSNLLNLANLRIEEELNDIDKRANKHYDEIVEKAKIKFNKNKQYIETLDFRNEAFGIEDLI